MHFEYHRPDTAEEALRLKEATPEARYLAGGTDLFVQMKSGRISPEAVISLRNIASLNQVTCSDDGVSIGALTPLTDLLDHATLQERYPMLMEAITTVGSPQIRNTASLGGNLCNASPCADTAPALMALDAQVRVAGKGQERLVPLDSFFTGPGKTVLDEHDLLTAIELSTPAAAGRGIFLKKVRVRMDLALVNLAAWLELADDNQTCSKVRLVAGAVAPVPLRLVEVEKMLEGKKLSESLLEEAATLAAASVSPISDVRAGADYRRHIVGVFVKRALRTIVEQRSA